MEKGRVCHVRPSKQQHPKPANQRWRTEVPKQKVSRKKGELRYFDFVPPRGPPAGMGGGGGGRCGSRGRKAHMVQAEAGDGGQRLRQHQSKGCHPNAVVMPGRRPKPRDGEHKCRNDHDDAATLDDGMDQIPTAS